MCKSFWVWLLLFILPGSVCWGDWVVDDLWQFYTKPATFLFLDYSPWFWAGTTGLVYLVDGPLSYFYIDQIEPPITETRVYKTINDINFFNTIFVANIWADAVQNKKLYQATFLGSQAVVNSIFIAQSLKHVFCRARPVLSDKGPYSWLNGGTDIFGPYTSFPSSHATIYFSFFSVMGKVYEDELLWDGLGLLTFLGIVGHNHWISDMWVGYMLGKAIGSYVWHQNKDEDLTQQWMVYPFKRPGMSLIGFGALHRF